MAFRNTCPRRWLLLVLDRLPAGGARVRPGPGPGKGHQDRHDLPADRPRGAGRPALPGRRPDRRRDHQQQVPEHQGAARGPGRHPRRAQDRAGARRQPGQARRGQGRGRTADQPGRRLRPDRLLQQLGEQAGQLRGRARQEDLHVRRLQLRRADPARHELLLPHGPHRRDRVHGVRRGHEVGQQDPERQREDHRRHLREQRVRQARRRGGQEGGRRRRLPGHGRRALQPRRDQPRQRGPDPQVQKPRRDLRRLPRGRLLAVGAHHEEDGLDAQDDPQLLHRVPGPGHHQAARRRRRLLHGLHRLLARSSPR